MATFEDQSTPFEFVKYLKSLRGKREYSRCNKFQLLKNMTQNRMSIPVFGAAAAIFLTTLVGCGGAATTETVTSTLSFPLKDAYSTLIASGAASSFTISGSCSGKASFVQSAPGVASFEGGTGLSYTEVQTATFTNCSPATTTVTTTNYVDTNYVPLGSTIVGGYYGVYLTPPVIPSSVLVGNIGTLGTQTFYTDSTKTLSVGQVVWSYAIEPDTANSAIVNLISRSYNLNATLTGTDEVRYRITTSAPLTKVSIDTLSSGGSLSYK